MGEAKRRGTKEQRVLAPKGKVESLQITKNFFPIHSGEAALKRIIASMRRRGFTQERINEELGKTRGIKSGHKFAIDGVDYVIDQHGSLRKWTAKFVSQVAQRAMRLSKEKKENIDE